MILPITLARIAKVDALIVLGHAWVCVTGTSSGMQLVTVSCVQIGAGKDAIWMGRVQYQL